MRTRVGTGASVLIGGLNIPGNGSVKLLMRAVGPGLPADGVADAMVDPQLTLYRGVAAVAFNDNWSSGVDAGRYLRRRQA